MPSKLIFILLFLSTFLCCKSVKSTSGVPDVKTTAKVIFEENKSLLVQLRITSNSANVHNFRILDVPYKPTSNNLRQSEILRLQFLNSEKQILLEETVNNPLIQYHEYADDAGNLSYTKSEVEEAHLLIRVPYAHEMQWLSVSIGDQGSFRQIAFLVMEKND